MPTYMVHECDVCHATFTMSMEGKNIRKVKLLVPPDGESRGGEREFIVCVGCLPEWLHI